MAFKDSFGRADQDLEQSGNWTRVGGIEGGARVVSNQLSLFDTGNDGTLYLSPNFDDHAHYAGVVNNTANGGFGVFPVVVRASTPQQYVGFQWNTSTDQWEVWLKNGSGGPGFTLLGSNALPAFVTGMRMDLEIDDDDQVTALIDGSPVIGPLAGNLVVGIPSSTRTGLVARRQVHDPALDDWESGTLAEKASVGTSQFVILSEGGKFGPYNARIQGFEPFPPDFVSLSTTELIKIEHGERYRFRCWGKWDYDGATNPTPDLRLRVLYYDLNGAQQDSALIAQLALATDPDLVTDRGVWKRLIGTHTVPNDAYVFARVQARADYDVNDEPHWWHLDGFMMRQLLAFRTVIATSTQAVNALDDGSGGDWNFIRSVTVGSPGDTVNLEASCEARIAADSAAADIQLRVRLIRYDSDGVSNPEILEGPHFYLQAVQAGSTYPNYKPAGMTFPASGDPQHLGETPWTSISIAGADTTGDRGEFVYRAEFSTNGANGRAQVRNRLIEFELE